MQIKIDHKKSFAALFIFIIIAFLVNSVLIRSDWIIGSDGLRYYAPLRSFIVDGDLHFENEFRDFNPYNHSVEDINLKTETGYVMEPYPVGLSLLWMPFFITAHSLTYALNLLGFHIPLSGYSILYQLFIGFGSIVYGLFGIFLMYRISRRFFGKSQSAVSLITIILATNVLYYFINEPTMSHIISMFSVSLFVYLWLLDYGKRKPRSYLCLGIISGLMIMVRYQNALFMILPLFELVKLAINRRLIQKSVFKNAAIYLGTTLMALIPQLIFWKIIYGHFLVYTYRDITLNFFAPKLIETLFSSRHGLISWTPIILFSLIGLYYFIKKHREIGYLFLLCFILQWYINSAWEIWWFGHAYGGRAFINCTFIFVLGLAALIDRFRGERIYLYILFSVLIVWNFSLMSQYILGLIPHGDYVGLELIMENHLRVIPIIISKLMGA